MALGEKKTMHSRAGCVLCLLGPNLCDDRVLRRRLTEHGFAFDPNSERDHWKADVLVVESVGNANVVIDFIVEIMRNRKHVHVILVNGGLKQSQIATAYSKGIKDYFKAPYDCDLIVERICALATPRVPRPKLSNRSQENTSKRREQD